jgi:hypothetical protein
LICYQRLKDKFGVGGVCDENGLNKGAKVIFENAPEGKGKVIRPKLRSLEGPENNVKELKVK